MFTKSGIMVGLGEARNEVLQLMDDLRTANVDFLTIGQYLQPTRKHHPVKAFHHAGRVQGLRDHSIFERLPSGIGQPADPFLAPCRRGFRPIEGGKAGGVDRELTFTRMPKFEKVHRVAHSAERMFDLVMDMEKYPEFLPLCEALRVRSRRQSGDREILVAEMTVGYKAIRETFTTQDIASRADLTIDISYLNGPFRRLDNRWRFVPVGDNACDVHFSIDYEFSSRILAALMGAMFDRAFRKFTAAFEARADNIYGVSGKLAANH